MARRGLDEALARVALRHGAREGTREQLHRPLALQLRLLALALGELPLALCLGVLADGLGTLALRLRPLQLELHRTPAQAELRHAALAIVTQVPEVEHHPEHGRRSRQRERRGELQERLGLHARGSARHERHQQGIGGQRRELPRR